MNLVISDMHFGSPLVRFEPVIKRLIMSDQYERIFINGDTLDVWEYDIARLVSMKADIINTINSVARDKSIVMVRGNHDPSIDELAAVFSNCEVVSEYAVGRVKFVHGDQFDILIKKYSWLARMFDGLQWLLERVGINLYTSLRSVTHSIAAHREKRYYNDLVIDVEDSIFDMYKGQYDIIFAGHTHLHKLVSKQVGDRVVLYANSGDWTYNNTYIEYNESAIFVKSWDGAVIYGKSLP